MSSWVETVLVKLCGPPFAVVVAAVMACLIDFGGILFAVGGDRDEF